MLGAGGNNSGLHPPLLPELLPSRAARICFPEERPRELLRRLASFLGVAPRAESSSRAALYSSIFSSKPGPDSVLRREEETPHAGSEHNQDPGWLAEAPRPGPRGSLWAQARPADTHLLQALRFPPEPTLGHQLRHSHQAPKCPIPPEMHCARDPSDLESGGSPSSPSLPGAEVGLPSGQPGR